MERDQVAALLAGADGYLSGEEMSRALGVTREIGRASCRERV